jgi:electron transport complex protein RnfD
VIFATCVASLAAEALCAVVRQKEGTIQISAVLLASAQGLITGMFFPESYPPFAAFVLTLCALLVAKYAFGGAAASWINSAAFTVAIAYFVGSRWFPEFLITKSDLAMENPSRLLLDPAASQTASRVTAFLNATVFRLAGIALPDGYLPFLWDTHAAIPAFRFNILILLASIVLIVFDIVSWIVPLCYVGVYAVLVWIFAPAVAGNGLGNGDILLALLTGGTLFTAFFMLNWFGTVPMTTQGKITYGCLSGAFAFVFCGSGASPAGAMFTVLTANLMSVFIQLYEKYRRQNEYATRLAPAIADYWRLSHGNK